MKQKFTFPDLSLVVLIGASGSGKSTFARKHFLPTEVISSDYCRALVSDDENDLAATNDAFEVLHFIAAKRLASGRLTVVDATNVKPEDRKSLIELARQYHCLPVAIVLNVPKGFARTATRSAPIAALEPTSPIASFRVSAGRYTASTARGFDTCSFLRLPKKPNPSPWSTSRFTTTRNRRPARSISSGIFTAATTRARCAARKSGLHDSVGRHRRLARPASRRA